MAITNLTNTVWVLNYSLNCPKSFGIFSVNYFNYHSYDELTSNFTSFNIGYLGQNARAGIISLRQANDPSSYTVYNEPGSLSVEERIITFTGGQDITNVTFINWLNSNAKQVLINDLSRTTWELNNERLQLRYMGASLDYDINFVSMGSEYNSASSISENYTYYLYYNDYEVYNDSNHWEDTKLRTIYISSGTDVSNAYLIYWLYGNATLQPTVSYSITVSATNLTYSGDNSIDKSGTATVTLTAPSGYVLPSSITVSGASYTYNNTTGVISLSNPTGNVTITASGITVKTFDLSTLQLSAGTHTVQIKARASGYRDSAFSNSVTYTNLSQLDAPVISLSGDTLTITKVSNAENYNIYANDVLKESLSNTYSVTLTISEDYAEEHKEYFRIYDGIDNTGTLLYESTSGASLTPQTLTCTSNLLYFEFGCDDDMYVSVSTTGGVSQSNYSEYSNYNEDYKTVFNVLSDGTISLYINWWDD